MSTEHMFLGGCAVIFFLSLLYAARNRSPVLKARVQSAVATIRSFEPAAVQAVQAVEPTAAQLLVSLHDKLDAEGKMTAALRTVGRLANSLADGHETKMGSTFAPKDQPAPPPAS